MSTSNMVLSIVDQFLSTSIPQQNSTFQQQTLGSIYCYSSYSSSSSIYCSDCCCYSDQERGYPYCCSCDDLVFSIVWSMVVGFLVFVGVIVIAIVALRYFRRNRLAQRQAQYQPFGVSPIVQPGNINYPNPNNNGIVFVPNYRQNVQNLPINNNMQHDYQQGQKYQPNQNSYGNAIQQQNSQNYLYNTQGTRQNHQFVEEREGVRQDDGRREI